jgi:transcriptional regulator with XRE-family HTH domain
MSQSKESSQEIGVYLHRLRKERKLTLKEVSVYLGIDVSMLSKIEHGERQLQSHMLLPISNLFNIDFKDFQIRYLNQKIEQEFGGQPYLKESLKKYLQKIEAS